MTRARDLANLVGSGNFSSTTFTATEGQTAFTISHTQGFVQVFMNGLLLDETADYTSNGTAITLTSGASAGDEIEVVAYNTFSVGDAQTQAAADTRYVNTAGDTMTGNLGVGGAANGTYAITSHSSGGANLRLENDGEVGFIRLEDDGDLNIWAHGDENISFLTGTGSGTTQMNIDGSGRVTKPSQPCFVATRNSNHVIGTSDAVIPIDIEDFDVGNNYNTSTYTFTAPVAGKYLFAFQATINSINTGTYNACYMHKNGSGTGYRFRTLTGSGWTGISGTIVISLAVNDYVSMYGYAQSGSMMLQSGEIHFMGYLIG